MKTTRPRRTRRRFGSTSGQALTEAAILLSLFAFVWMMSAYVTFKLQNGIRTAMASRHGAWMRGHGLTVSTGPIEDDFFIHTGIASVGSQSSDTVSLPGIFASLSSGIGGIAYQVENVSVGFDVETKRGTAQPYVGLDIQPAYVRGGPLFSVSLRTDSTSSQWPRITEFFTDRSQLSTYANMIIP
jgi:hypothetical protein